MAASAILKIRKIAISRPRFEQFRQNLAWLRTSTLLTVPNVKNFKFWKSKLWIDMHMSFNIDEHLTEQHWQPVFLFSKPSVSIRVCCSYIELSRSKLHKMGDLQVGNWHVNYQHSSFISFSPKHLLPRPLTEYQYSLNLSTQCGFSPNRSHVVPISLTCQKINEGKNSNFTIQTTTNLSASLPTRSDTEYRK